VSWQYVGLYVAMFVSSPPFLTAAALFGGVGIAVGWLLRRPRSAR
jgi:hypothetical protein